MSQIIKTNPFVSIYKPSFVDFSLINKLGSVTVDMAKKYLWRLMKTIKFLKKKGLL